MGGCCGRKEEEARSGYSTIQHVNVEKKRHGLEEKIATTSNRRMWQ